MAMKWLLTSEKDSMLHKCKRYAATLLSYPFHVPNRRIPGKHTNDLTSGLLFLWDMRNDANYHPFLRHQAPSLWD
jgi:hypothetical protein